MYPRTSPKINAQNAATKFETIKRIFFTSHNIDTSLSQFEKKCKKVSQLIILVYFKNRLVYCEYDCYYECYQVKLIYIGISKLIFVFSQDRGQIWYNHWERELVDELCTATSPQ